MFFVHRPLLLRFALDEMAGPGSKVATWVFNGGSCTVTTRGFGGGFCLEFEKWLAG